MRFPVRTLAALIAIFALLSALALPANADLLCALPLAECLLPLPAASGDDEFRADAVVPQPLSLESVLPSRAPPSR